jgi:hypothetical protein
MCYERYLRRREEEDAEQSRRMWHDFERTTPLAGDDRPAEDVQIRAEAEPAEPATADR